MKGSKSISWCWILFAIATAVLLGGACFSVKSFLHKSECPGDLRLRYNESVCAHSGVNPFHIWNHDISSSMYRGLSRPDKSESENMPGYEKKDVVHAYPPWHMAYTWFYGWLSYPYVIAILFLVNGLILSLLWRTVKHHCKQQNRFSYWLVCLFFLLVPCLWNILTGNYGIICAGLLLGMIATLEKSQVMAGICWGLMMIKPQIATLLFFPLLFQKKYVAIGTAILMCLIATLWPAYVYRESPLDLILQVPLIGAPYEMNVFFSFLKSRAPVSYMYLKGGLTLCCVVLCAYSSWLWRTAKNPIFRYAPVAFIFPLWLYSLGYDLIAAWPFVLLLAVLLPDMLKRPRIKRVASFYIFYYIVFRVFNNAFWACVGMFDLWSFLPKNMQCFNIAIQVTLFLVQLLFGAYILTKKPFYWGL